MATSPPQYGVFGHVGLTVSNLDQMIGFFTQILGFDVNARLKPIDPDAVAGITGVDGAVAREIAYLSRGDLTFELLQYEAPEPARSTLRPCDPGYMHWLVDVDDLPSAAQAAAGFGFNISQTPHRIRLGPNAGKIGTYLRHPDGFAIELIGRDGPRP